MGLKSNNIEEQRGWNKPEFWSDNGDEWSKEFGTTENLWLNYIYPNIKRFKNKTILEIAPGYGRITAYLINIAKSLTIVDLNENCISECKKRFGNHIDGYYVNDGESLSDIPDDSMDLVFSYDSFVHMHLDVIESYVKEIGRVLKPGGHCWLHHSNLYGGEEMSFENWGGRANMDITRFGEMLTKNKFSIITRTPHITGESEDFITFFVKN